MSKLADIKNYNPDCDPYQDDTQNELDKLDRPVIDCLPSVEDAKQWKRDKSGYYVSPELENQVAKFMSDYAMEVLARSGYFDDRDYEGEA